MYLAEIKESNHELASAELNSAGDVREEYTGVAVTPYVDHPEYLAMTHRINRYLGKTELQGDGFTEEDREAVLRMVEAADTEFEGSYSVRVKTVGNQDSSVESLERDAGSLLFGDSRSVDLEKPEHRYRLIFTDGHCFFGRELVETGSFEERKPMEKPYFRPGCMDPMTARALTNLAGGQEGAVLLDPMCGTAGVLIEAGLCGADTLGFDVEPEILRGARMNQDEYLDSRYELCLGDAANLPLPDDSVDCAVTDLPYGKASLVEGKSLDGLICGVLDELDRVVKGRVVVVSDGWISEKAEDAEFEVKKVITDRVHRSLTRKIHVLHRT
ncbi:MAG: methyltransferase domain-containing protein [Halobacteria archaeon]